MAKDSKRADVKHEDAPADPFVAGSRYRVRSLGTHEAPVETEGEFLGFTSIGMGGQGMRIRLGKSHEEDAGRVRVIPLHMVLHIDILAQKTPEDEKEDDGHPVSYS